MNAGNVRVGGAVGFRISYLTQVSLHTLPSLSPMMVGHTYLAQDVAYHGQQVVPASLCGQHC